MKFRVVVLEQVYEELNEAALYYQARYSFKISLFSNV